MLAIAMEGLDSGGTVREDDQGGLSMNTRQKKKVPSAKQLSILAMQFRGTRDEAERTSIAQAYSKAVAELIVSKEWRRIPPLEDQLPDEWMPGSFFEYWSLRPPPLCNGEDRR